MKKLLCIAILVVVAFSCTKNSDSNSGTNTNNDPAPTCTGTKSFSADVNPIIQNVCAASGCHNAGSSNGPGPLTNYQQVFNARTTIRSAVASGLMPKNSTLSASQKNDILCWIDNGASNN